MKKAFCLLLTFAVTLTMLPVSFADDGERSGLADEPALLTSGKEPAAEEIDAEFLAELLAQEEEALSADALSESVSNDVVESLSNPSAVASLISTVKTRGSWNGSRRQYTWNWTWDFTDTTKCPVSFVYYPDSGQLQLSTRIPRTYPDSVYLSLLLSVSDTNDPKQLGELYAYYDTETYARDCHARNFSMKTYTSGASLTFYGKVVYKDEEDKEYDFSGDSFDSLGTTFARMAVLSWQKAMQQLGSGNLADVGFYAYNRQTRCPCATPVLTEAFNSATGVRVSWNPTESGAKFRLLRKNVTLGETVWKSVGVTTECTLIDKTAKSSNRYTYTVERVNDDNCAISRRDETGRTCTYIAKADVTELKVTAEGVGVAWTKPAGAKNFRVMRRPDGTAKWTVLAVIEGTSYLDTTAQKGVKYWYTVRGVSMDNKVLINSYNGTGWSIRPTDEPVLTEAFNSATGVRVSWTAAEGASKFRLLRKNLTLGETEWKNVGETEENTLIDKTAKSSNRYTYTVECIDVNGRVCSTRDETGRTCTFIAMARITELKSTDDGISVTWEKPAGAKNFRVFRKIEGGGWQILTDVQDTTYTDTTAQEGVRYWYTVRAVSMDGRIYINSYNATGWSVTR
ncbi:MAG: hypothetical protein K6G17_07625 [Oscillospiraceae bacterium]|nr:hypothetical protein [Oscillospiraceae bacterium]